MSSEQPELRRLPLAPVLTTPLRILRSPLEAYSNGREKSSHLLIAFTGEVFTTLLASVLVCEEPQALFSDLEI